MRTLDFPPDAAKHHPVLLRADRTVPYGELANVLEILRSGGYFKIKLVTLGAVADPAASAASVQPAKP